MDRHRLARHLEHTNLRPDATEADIRQVCSQALQHEFRAVVVNPVWVPEACRELKGSYVSVVTVAGFPLGASRPEVKVVEAVRGAIDGAAEIDMVANIGWILAGDWQRAEAEITQVRKTLPLEAALKVIIEAPLLTKEQQIDATTMAINAGAQFVKTGTGFQGGVTVEQVRTLVQAARGNLRVKAAGGIRTVQQCLSLLEAGAERLGTSASPEIMRELPSDRAE
jgi:deoxyribose-phosphate aldolase